MSRDPLSWPAGMGMVKTLTNGYLLVDRFCIAILTCSWNLTNPQLDNFIGLAFFPEDRFGRGVEILTPAGIQSACKNRGSGG